MSGIQASRASGKLAFHARLTESSPSHQTFEQALTSNALFTRLATAYGMKEKLLIHPPPAKIRDREFKKVLADSFEAYFGLLWRQCRKGERPISDFQNYFAKLFSAEVFPDLEKELKRWQEVRDNGKKENIIAKKRKGCKRLLEEGENDIRDHKKRAISPQTLDTSPISASPSTDTFFGIETILLEKQIFELSKSS